MVHAESTGACVIRGRLPCAAPDSPLWNGGYRLRGARQVNKRDQNLTCALLMTEKRRLTKEAPPPSFLPTTSRVAPWTRIVHRLLCSLFINPSSLSAWYGPFTRQHTRHSLNSHSTVTQHSLNSHSTFTQQPLKRQDRALVVKLTLAILYSCASGGSVMFMPYCRLSLDCPQSVRQPYMEEEGGPPKVRRVTARTCDSRHI